MSSWAAYSARARSALRRHTLDVLDERGILGGMRIEFPAPGSCELRAFEEAGPGPGELLIDTLATVISPGTERAVFLRLETTSSSYPFVAGYCHAGRVVAAGSGSRVQPGELVATGGPHASLVVCAEARALTVPEGVPVESAALIQLGFTALQAVRKATIEPGERLLVLGAGLVGQLAAQLARDQGAEVHVAARSRPRLEIARACGFERLIDTTAEPAALESFEADAILEATGSPQALHHAALAARRGGRIVLLGSSRGVTKGIDVARWQAKSLVVLGAHTWNTPAADRSRHYWPWRRECEVFLGLLAQKRLVIEPLITRRVLPSEAPSLYADIAKPEDKSVAVVLDWSRPGPWRSRIEAPSPWRGVGRALLTALGRSARPAGAASRRLREGGRVVRFGLIGCGEIAVENARAMRAADNCAVRYAVDLDAEAARRLAAASGASHSARLEDLLESSDVDAVLISTPHHLHAPLAIAAADAGKHVVVEKPMATSAAECDRMIEAARRRGVLLSVCYAQRFEPQVQRARHLMQAGVLGDVFATRIVFGQYRGSEYWTSGLAGRSTSDWRARRDTAGGGVLIMNACHLLDYMTWLVASPISQVSAITERFLHEVEVEDSVAMGYRYESGALGSLEATTAQVGPHTFEQVVRGRSGQLVVAPTLRFWSEKTAQGYEAGRWHTIRNLPRSESRRQFFESFADAILDGTVPLVRADEARAVQAAIDAAYLSAVEKRVVNVVSSPVTQS